LNENNYDLGDLFNQASEIYCGEEDCFVGTCPVNCLVSIINEHLKQPDNEWLLFADWMLLKRLTKK